MVQICVTHFISSHRKMPNQHDDQQVQELVEAVKHPVRFLLLVCQYWIAGGEATFARIDEEMRNEFRQHQQKQQLPCDTPYQETQPYQQGVDSSVLHDWPNVASICLRPYHRGGGQAKICQVMANQQNDQKEFMHFFLSTHSV